MSKTTLDEIFDDYEMIGETFSTNPKETKDIPYLKQAILHWVADEVIGEDEEETIEDKLGGKYRFNSNKRRRNKVRRNQRKILAQNGYKGGE